MRKINSNHSNKTMWKFSSIMAVWLAFTFAPWQLTKIPPKCESLPSVSVMLGNSELTSGDGYIYVEREGSPWGKIFTWKDSPLNKITGLVEVKAFAYKTGEGKKAGVFYYPAWVAQGGNVILNCKDYSAYIDGWWLDVYWDFAKVFAWLMLSLMCYFLGVKSEK